MVDQNELTVGKNIERYFIEEIGSKTLSAEPDYHIDWTNSVDMVKEYTQIFQSNSIPFRISQVNGFFINLYGEEVGEGEYELRYALFNTPSNPNLIREVNFVLNYLAKKHEKKHHVNRHRGMGIEDDNGYDSYIMHDIYRYLEENNIQKECLRYLCISKESVETLNAICDSKGISTETSVDPGSDHEWNYLIEKYHHFWNGFKWIPSKDYSSYFEKALKIMDECHISYVLIIDENGDLSLEPHIFEEKHSYGYRRDLGCIMRSSWEANIARVLNHKNIRWEYEKDRYIFSESLSYLPDFFLPNNTILEIKGYWDSVSIMRISAFHKNYPDIALDIIDGDMYSTIKLMYKNILNEWEEDGQKASLVMYSVPIVGFRHYISDQVFNTLKPGDMIYLEREMDNVFDRNAILAYSTEKLPLGHIGAEWTYIISSKMDLGMTYTGIIKEITSKVIWADIKRSNPDDIIIYDYLKDISSI